MSDDAFAAQFLRRRPDLAAAVESARALTGELAGAGVPFRLDEVLLRLSVVDDGARCETWRALGVQPPPAAVARDVASDERTARAIAAASGLGPADLESVRAFQAWARERGFEIGVSEILERRGFGAPTPAPSAPRSDRRPRKGPEGRTRRGARPARKGPGGLAIGLAAAGGGLGLVVLLAVLFSGGSSPPTPPVSSPASRPAGPSPAPSAEPAPRNDLERSLAELEDRFGRALAAGNRDAARRQLEMFERGLTSPADRERVAARLDRLRASLGVGQEPERPAPVGGDSPAPRPARDEPIDHVARIEAAMREGGSRLAIQWANRFVEASPGEFRPHFERGRHQFLLANYYLALQDLGRAESIAAANPGRVTPELRATLHVLKSQCYTYLLDFESGRREALRSLEIPNSAVDGNEALAVAYWLEGDATKAIEHFMLAANKVGMDVGKALQIVLASLELGMFRDAQDGITWATRNASQPAHRRAIGAVRAWALVDPSNSTEPDLEGALALAEQEAPIDGPALPQQTAIVAALRSMAGDHRGAFDILQTYAPEWDLVPSTGFYLARSALALGYEEEARQIFQRACRLRPKLAARFPLGDEAGRLLGRARREATDRASKSLEEQEALRVEDTERLLGLSQIEALELAYRFDEATAEYRRLAERVTSRSTWQEADRAASRAAALAALLVRIVDRAGAGGLTKVSITVGSSKATVSGGDEAEAELRMGEGSARVPWAFLGIVDFAALAEAVQPSASEWLALGSLCLAGRAEDEGWSALARAWKDPSCRGEIDRLVAERRGLEIPSGGFVLHRGAFVTPEEKAHLDRGLVLFRGEWVTKEDRERTLRGFRKIRGEWTRLGDDDLRARGWEKVGEEWLTPAEVASRKGLWADAQERQTAHFILRSDRGAQFLDELAEVLEAAWPEYEKAFGGRPSSDRKLVVLAFKDFEGYREYCRRIGQTQALGALGFAPSEEYTCCGYDKFGDTRMFLDTLVHEAAHLYFWVSFRKPLPSWLAEGMATYFEGFQRTGGAYRFHQPSANRLDTLRSGRLAEGFDLEALTAGEALKLIQTSPGAAIDFYARCWGLFYFLSCSIDPVVQEVRRDVLARARAGGEVDLVAIIGPERRKAFDQALLEFLRNL